MENSANYLTHSMKGIAYFIVNLTMTCLWNVIFQTDMKIWNFPLFQNIVLEDRLKD